MTPRGKVPTVHVGEGGLTQTITWGGKANVTLVDEANVPATDTLSTHVPITSDLAGYATFWAPIKWACLVSLPIIIALLTLIAIGVWRR